MFNWMRRPLAFVLAAFPALVFADWSAVNMPDGVTSISRDIKDLHMLIFWICCVIAAIVYGAILWSVYNYRKSVYPKPATFHENTTLELLWTIIPSLILLAMAYPSVQVLREMYDQSEGEINIKVTGYQWKWRYEYLDDTDKDNLNFFSVLSTPPDEIANLEQKGENYLLEVDEPVVIPVDTKVRFLITANDVLHAFWVPDFAVKQDAIPGMINTAWTLVEEIGIYRGQCAELCGKEHGFMPIVVRAVEKEEYQQWYQQKIAAAEAKREAENKEWTREELYEMGEQVYNRNCLVCHQANGEGIPPAFPTLKGSQMALQDLDTHIDTVVNGVTGSGMAAFGNQLSAAELAAVITYERLAWGNDAAGDGRIATPKMILKAQGK